VIKIGESVQVKDEETKKEIFRLKLYPIKSLLKREKRERDL
jgi:hypothetical protein